MAINWSGPRTRGSIAPNPKEETGWLRIDGYQTPAFYPPRGLCVSDFAHPLLDPGKKGLVCGRRRPFIVRLWDLCHKRADISLLLLAGAIRPGLSFCLRDYRAATAGRSSVKNERSAGPGKFRSVPK